MLMIFTIVNKSNLMLYTGSNYYSKVITYDLLPANVSHIYILDIIVASSLSDKTSQVVILPATCEYLGNIFLVLIADNGAEFLVWRASILVTNKEHTSQ